MKRLPYIFIFLAMLLCAGCGGSHSAWVGDGPQSFRIAQLLKLFTIICTTVWAIVVIAMLYGVIHPRRRELPENVPDVHPDHHTEKRAAIAVSVSVFITVVILFLFVITDFVTGRAIHEFAYSGNPVGITVIGHQWWWEIHYDDADPSKIIVTANEMHIPVGRPVKIQLTSADVIHSFWVPNLHGKKDLFPEHQNALWLQADKAGTYYGQCAEFCGFEHAKMRIMVVAESPEKFERWLSASRESSKQPKSAEEKHGQEVFLSGTCSMCHTILGTNAHGRVGPDLTHIASRQTLAAGSIPNRTGYLAGWINDPQHIKPAVYMPANVLPPKDMRDLVTYLESLK